MGLFSKDIKTMDDLFVHTLQDIYYAENQIVKALPEMIEKATDAQLKQGFQTHLERDQEADASASSRCARCTAATVKGVNCPAIDGIIEEAEEIAGEVDDKRCSMQRCRRRASGGTLRDRALRHADRLGQAARAQRLRSGAAEEPRRGKGDGQEAHRDRGEKGQPQGRLTPLNHEARGIAQVPENICGSGAPRGGKPGRTTSAVRPSQVPAQLTIEPVPRHWPPPAVRDRRPEPLAPCDPARAAH